MTKQIGIVGIAASSGNRGVLALGSSLVELCSIAGGNTRIVIFAGSKSSGNLQMRVNGYNQQVPIINYRLSFKSGLSKQLFWIFLISIIYRIIPIKVIRNAISSRVSWISEMEKCQIVGDVRGGDSFSDIYGMKRFIIGFIISYSVILVKGSIVQFPQTYGPFKSRIARSMARFLLRRSSMIIARDEKSRKAAIEVLGGPVEVKLSPDVAFSLEAVLPDKIDLDPPQEENFPTEIIGINVNGLVYNGGYNRQNMFGLKIDYAKFLQSIISDLLKESPNAEVWLVPHTYAPVGDVESDNEACQKVWDSLLDELKSHVRVVTGEYDQHEIKGVIGQSGFFLGSRMHSCIAALSQGIPCVGLAYSMKFQGVFSSVGVGDWVVDARKVNNNQAIKTVLDLYRLREVIRSDLQQASEGARLELREVFRNLINA